MLLPSTKSHSTETKRVAYSRLPRYLWITSFLVVAFSICFVLLDPSLENSRKRKEGLNVSLAWAFSSASSRFASYVASLNASFGAFHWLSWMIPTWNIPMPSGRIDSRLPIVAELRHDAYRSFQLVERLREHKFFRVFKIDLAKECPFWARREMCTSPGACQVCECNEDQIPIPWKLKPVQNFVDRNHYNSTTIRPWGEDASSDATAYDKIWTIPYPAKPMLYPSGLVSTLSDEGSSSASYVDLTLNRPGYTAYRGRNIWRLIYQENCMGDLKNPLENARTAHASTQCTEEEAFHKIVSGMQTVIMVLSSEYHHSKKTPEEHQKQVEEYKKKGQVLNTAAFRAQYSPSLRLFKERVAVDRAWLENLYFTFGVLLRTLCRVAPVLETCDCDTGTPDDDFSAKQDLRQMLREPFFTCDKQYLYEPLFHRRQQLALRQFNNISRIMDCLECEKCRLHGKVKMVALQLALRASGNATHVGWVERNEVIALVNSIGYFADAIIILDKFRGRLLLLRVAGALAVALILSLITSACRYVYRKRLKTKLRETQWTDTTDTDDDHDSVDTTPSVEHGPVPPSSLRRKRTEAPAPTMKRQKKLS